MNWDDTRKVIEEARRRVVLGDAVIRDLANLLPGRLRSTGVLSWVLADLKRELRNYNIHTQRWKDEK